jgi:hypothetical protein
MEDFEVDGTTLLSWTIRVRAHNERDALDEAQRIATWVEISSSLATVHRGAVRHLALPRDRSRE